MARSGFLWKNMYGYVGEAQPINTYSLALRLPPDSATLSFTIRPSLCHGAWDVSGITLEFAAVGAGKSIYLGDLSILKQWPALRSWLEQ
jgi:hypothetical protein